MPVRTADAEWRGDLPGGNGTMRFGGGAFEGRYSFASRFENGTGTNPEELIAAAHAGCFSMALSNALARGGFTPKSVKTRAGVHLDRVAAGFKITGIDLDTEANVPGIPDARFHEIADEAKRNCPVSQALASVEIRLNARLVAG